jgi:hypothetical protein
VSVPRVRLDDALIGRLPPVCVMSGERAGGYAPFVVPKKLGIAWALLLAGPIGVCALIALYPRLRTRYVVKLPMSAAAFDRWHAARAQRVWCVALGVGGLALAAVTRWMGPLSLLIALASLWSLLVAVRAHWRIGWAQPSLSVDTAGRSLTLLGAHERFAAAYAVRD